MNSKPHRKRVLFFAEAVTLAHITRPLVLAQCLDPNRFEVHFACAPRKNFLVQDSNFTRWPIYTITEEAFLRALSKGAPIYDPPTLTKYIDDDIALLHDVQPDFVVGDFRLSLAVSAPICKVPYIALTNAHWSPFTELKHFPLPDSPFSRIFGASISSSIFHAIQPVVFAYHSRPLNKLRRRYGLPPLGNLLDVYTHGDYTLYADVPCLVPTRNLPPNHRYIGPVFWSPAVELPAGCDRLDDTTRVIYVTLGSSGNIDLLPMILKVLTEFSVPVMVATAGRLKIDSLPENVWAADFLPGDKVVKRSQLVICNGGSATAYQALREGVPVLGVPSNMDQFLTMTAVEKLKAGILLRPERMNTDTLHRNISRLLNEQACHAGAQQVAAEIVQFDAISNFRSFVDELVGPKSIARRHNKIFNLPDEL